MGREYRDYRKRRSSLFTWDASQGESKIRRWIIENDWLEVIVEFQTTAWGPLLRMRNAAYNMDRHDNP